MDLSKLITDMVEEKSNMPPRCIVRVATEAFIRGGTVFYGRTIRTMKRKSNYDLLLDQIGVCDVCSTIELIQNFNEVSDGIYELAVVNWHQDYWTGEVDYELKLLPFKED